MPVLNRIAGMAEEMQGWRRHLHMHPELSFDCHQTAAFVAERLREFGVDEIHEGIAQTGIVAIINGQEPGRTIGLRSDMDALPNMETSGVEYASTVPGKAHSCGHDGHMTMLLGAARYLAETRRFAGRVALIFQPAEEDGGGGEKMVQAGIMDRFDIAEVYGIHNAPNLEFGRFITTPGPIMAAVDTLRVTIKGRSGHGALPHQTIDPVIATVGMVGALQSIISRNVPALDNLVFSVTMLHAGSASNVIPDEAMFAATIRTFTPEVRDLVEKRTREIINGHAAAYGVEVDIDYDRGYPATVNTEAETTFAAGVAAEISGVDMVDANTPKQMIAEDFSYLLEARPGCYLMLGTGPGYGLHHASFDFNDEAAPIGASFFARLVEKALPLA